MRSIDIVRPPPAALLRTSPCGCVGTTADTASLRKILFPIVLTEIEEVDILDIDFYLAIGVFHAGSADVLGVFGAFVFAYTGFDESYGGLAYRSVVVVDIIDGADGAVLVELGAPDGHGVGRSEAWEKDAEADGLTMLEGVLEYRREAVHVDDGMVFYHARSAAEDIFEEAGALHMGVDELGGFERCLIAAQEVPVESVLGKGALIGELVAEELEDIGVVMVDVAVRDVIVGDALLLAIALHVAIVLGEPPMDHIGCGGGPTLVHVVVFGVGGALLAAVEPAIFGLVGQVFLSGEVRYQFPCGTARIGYALDAFHPAGLVGKLEVLAIEIVDEIDVLTGLETIELPAVVQGDGRFLARVVLARYGDAEPPRTIVELVYALRTHHGLEDAVLLVTEGDFGDIVHAVTIVVELAQCTVGADVDGVIALDLDHGLGQLVGGVVIAAEGDGETTQHVCKLEMDILTTVDGDFAGVEQIGLLEVVVQVLTGMDRMLEGRAPMIDIGIESREGGGGTVYLVPRRGGCPLSALHPGIAVTAVDIEANAVAVFEISFSVDAHHRSRRLAYGGMDAY